MKLLRRKKAKSKKYIPVLNVGGIKEAAVLDLRPAAVQDGYTNKHFSGSVQIHYLSFMWRQKAKSSQK
jgi:hypothetical protein